MWSRVASGSAAANGIRSVVEMSTGWDTKAPSRRLTTPPWSRCRPGGTPKRRLAASPRRRGRDVDRVGHQSAVSLPHHAAVVEMSTGWDTKAPSRCLTTPPWSRCRSYRTPSGPPATCRAACDWIRSTCRPPVTGHRPPSASRLASCAHLTEATQYARRRPAKQAGPEHETECDLRPSAQRATLTDPCPSLTAFLTEQ